MVCNLSQAGRNPLQLTDSEKSSRHDIIRIKNIHVHAVLKTAASSFKTISILVTISILHDPALTAAKDTLHNSSYDADICETVVRSLNRDALHFPSLEAISEFFLDRFCTEYLNVRYLAVNILEESSNVAVELVLKESIIIRTYHLPELTFEITIGIKAGERLQKQAVKIKASLERRGGACVPLDYDLIIRRLRSEGAVEGNSFLTLEKLASYTAHLILTSSGCESDRVNIKAAKPGVTHLVGCSEIEISRTLPDFLIPSENGYQTSQAPQTIAIALGSNLGDKAANIEHALRLLEHKESDTAVINTSFLYETSPMYVTDQPTFLNCACLVETKLEPIALLKRLKLIETIVGRVPSMRNGPRAVDLDIVTYNNLVLDTRDPNQRGNLENLEGELVVPHPRLSEREFVLRPLNDMIPNFVHPVHRITMNQLLHKLLQYKSSQAEIMHKVTPFPTYRNPTVDPATSSPTLRLWKHYPQQTTTQVMATLNATPDSFSDGSVHLSLPRAMEYVASSVAAGAYIIDIGGYSTRPNASLVSVDEEVSRVVPIIQAIRTSLDVAIAKVLISVDTFQPEVAKRAIEAGANCVNDVYALSGLSSYPMTTETWQQFDKMKELIKDTSVPVIMMHSRGDAGSNKQYDEDGGVVMAIKRELGDKVQRAVTGRGAIRRWSIIVDPGIGFSKTLDGNLEVLRNSGKLVQGLGTNTTNPLEGFPILIGASRKSFLGAIIAKGEHGRQTEPKERDWATAAAISCAVQQGVDLVRVHDVKMMSDVVAVAKAVWQGVTDS